MEAYLQGDPDTLRFFDGSFRDPEAYRARAHWLDKRFDRAARERIAGILKPAGEHASDALRRFVAEDGFIVTTGQQPGLFSGPLYSPYKALSAIRLARFLEGLLGRTVLPLFWVASEDHDWAEMDHTWIVDLENTLRELRLPAPTQGSPDLSVHRIPMGSAVTTLVERLAAALPSTDFSAPYLDMIRAAYKPGATLASGFRRLMEGLTERHGMLFVDGHDEWVKETSLPVLLNELDRAEDHEQILQRTAHDLEDAGFHVQVPILPGGVNLFLEGPAGRERIYRHAGSFQLRHSGQGLTGAEIARRAEADCRSISPNVLLRPVVESTLFPVLSYVAGPGEMAYYAQLKDFFRAHESSMPVIHPRFSAVLMEPKIRKVLSKFELGSEALGRPFHELASDFAREQEPQEVRRALGQIRGGLVEGSKKLLQAATQVDPTLKGPVTHARNAAMAAFEEAEKRILQAVKRQNEIALSQLEKAQVHLYPNGKPQERVLNVFYYLARFGGDLIEALLGSFRIEMPAGGESLEVGQEEPGPAHLGSP